MIYLHIVLANFLGFSYGQGLCQGARSRFWILLCLLSLFLRSLLRRLLLLLPGSRSSSFAGILFLLEEREECRLGHKVCKGKLRDEIRRKESLTARWRWFGERALLTRLVSSKSFHLLQSLHTISYNIRYTDFIQRIIVSLISFKSICY